MGHILSLMSANNPGEVGSGALTTFRDIRKLPPELALLILSKLNATELCLAACVWQEIADSEFLWQNLCYQSWGYVTAYNSPNVQALSYKKLYMILDEASVMFNVDAQKGLDMLFERQLLVDDAKEIAKFIYSTRMLRAESKRQLFKRRPDLLDEIVLLQDFENEFLPNALRLFFSFCGTPNERDNFLSRLIDRFSERFLVCNPKLQMNKDAVYLLCYSLILLSVDLHSPHVKNKMSKREFIRNTRNVIRDLDDDYAGHLYDNVWIQGHLAPRPRQ